jgi:hypothetical protein
MKKILENNGPIPLLFKEGNRTKHLILCFLKRGRGVLKPKEKTWSLRPCFKT